MAQCDHKLLIGCGVLRMLWCLKAPPAPAPAQSQWLLETLPKPKASSKKWEQNLAALEKPSQMASASLECHLLHP